jgi:hypothetical protein
LPRQPKTRSSLRSPRISPIIRSRRSAFVDDRAMPAVMGKERWVRA